MDYKPQFFRLKEAEDLKGFNILKKEKDPQIYDTIESQVLELVLCRNPKLSSKEVVKKDLVERHFEDYGVSKYEYGVWVYYSWKNQLLHILDEEEFIEVRTNRNKYKITQEEQDILRSKKIGIAGLSVGRAVALTIALERIAGEIRLADFDTIELSNLNRIKAPLTELGINKCIAAARDIAEIDPYIKVTCFADGLTEDNLRNFFTCNGLMNLFIEECDDIDIKLKSRIVARELRIPVIMETNDNCVIDVERFDLEPGREIFHGRLDLSELANKSTSDIKMHVIEKVIDFKRLSKRMQISIPDIGLELCAWPQLASEVTYGGGIVCEFSRKILLGTIKESNQFYCSNWNVQ